MRNVDRLMRVLSLIAAASLAFGLLGLSGLLSR